MGNRTADKPSSAPARTTFAALLAAGLLGLAAAGATASHLDRRAQLADLRGQGPSAVARRPDRQRDRSAAGRPTAGDGRRAARGAALRRARRGPAARGRARGRGRPHPRPAARRARPAAARPQRALQPPRRHLSRRHARHGDAAAPVRRLGRPLNQGRVSEADRGGRRRPRLPGAESARRGRPAARRRRGGPAARRGLQRADRRGARPDRRGESRRRGPGLAPRGRFATSARRRSRACSRRSAPGPTRSRSWSGSPRPRRRARSRTGSATGRSPSRS